MRIQPFFTYFGGKWRSARKYPDPKYDLIIEPFAGSAGYSLNYCDRDVILYDLDPTICAVWEYLLSVKESEILDLPDVHPGMTVDDLDVCTEAKILIGFWLNKGASRPCKTPSAWMRGRTHPNSFWGEAIRRRISGQLWLIRHWKIENKHYSEAADRLATWFIDPPYEVRGENYVFGSSQVDYSHLASWCRSRCGQVIVCEQTGADWLPFSDLGSIKSTLGISREAVWCRP